MKREEKRKMKKRQDFQKDLGIRSNKSIAFIVVIILILSLLFVVGGIFAGHYLAQSMISN